ncbi:MAG: peroxiredoxin, partial [Fimbriimonadaceae bacterium]|nr:peroxiredoxin [Fimbriimonadaceae bacterium]
PIPVLFDPSLKIIHSYKAAASPWVVEVAKDGTIGQVWKGYSSKSLGEIGTKLASAAGVKPVQVDLKGAPGSMAFG